MRRELHEEVGIKITSKLKRLGEYVNSHEYKKDTVLVFVVDAFTQEDTKHFEVEKQEFFRPELLPERTSPGTHRRIEEWLGKRTVNTQW